MAKKVRRSRSIVQRAEPEKSNGGQLLEEWKQARGVLASFDDKLNDLRKYGFSFITALLTADSILDYAVKMTNPVKLAIYTVTLILIGAIFLMDRNYRVFQDAAVTRALVIERRLNLELSDVISWRYGIDRIGVFVLLVYLLFVLGVAVFGLSTFEREASGGMALSQPQGFAWCPPYSTILLVASLLMASCIIALNTLTLRFRNGSYEDWTLSTLELTRKDKELTVTVNNLTKNKSVCKKEDCMTANRDDLEKSEYETSEPIEFQKGKLIWEIWPAKGGTPIVEEAKDAALKVYDSYTWSVPARLFRKKGETYFFRPHDWPFPLFTIFVSS